MPSTLHLTDAVERPAQSVDSSLEIDVSPAHLMRFGAYVLAAVLVVGAIGRAHELVGLVVIAAVLAALVGPLVERLARVMGRVGATVLIHLILLFVVATLTAVAVQQIRAEARALEAFADTQLENAEAAGGLSPSNRVRVAQQLGDAAADWGTVAVVGEVNATAIAARVSQFVITIVLSIFFSLQSRQLLDAAMRTTANRDRRRVLRELWHTSVGAASAYLRRSLLFAAMMGAAVGSVAAARCSDMTDRSKPSRSRRARTTKRR